MPAFMFMLMMFGVLGAVILAESNAAEKRRLLFDRFAQRSGGRFLPGNSWGRRNRVMLVHRNHPVEVCQTSTGGKHPVFFLEASMGLRGQNHRGLRCEVYPERFLSSLGKLIGMQDLEIGQPVFDSRYILKSNDHDGLISFLDVRVRDAVDSVFMMFEDHDVYVHVDRDQVLLKRRRLLQQEGELDLFFRQALEVFDGALRTLGSIRQLPVDGAGIRFLGTEPTRGVAATGGAASGGVTFLPDSEGIYFEGQEPVALPPAKTCPVCGDELKGRLVVACASCDARHHQDCWEFNGSCSTYGCLSRMATDA